MIGYGEFSENNKPLVPSGYVSDWFASDLIEALDSEEKVNQFAEILGAPRRRLPDGIPSTGEIDSDSSNLEKLQRRRTWHHRLRKMTLDWKSVTTISKTFLTAVPPPWNLWWNDLPLEFVKYLIEAVMSSSIESAQNLQDGVVTEPLPDRHWMRLPNAATGWVPIDHTPTAFTGVSTNHQAQKSEDPIKPIKMPGLIDSVTPSSLGDWPRNIHHEEHGIVKSSLMILGIPHIHDANDILIIHGWQSLVEGLGIHIEEKPSSQPSIRVDALSHIDSRVSDLVKANQIVDEENRRVEDLEHEKSILRIEAETAARQRGETIEVTEEEGKKAADKIADPGPENPS